MFLYKVWCFLVMMSLCYVYNINVIFLFLWNLYNDIIEDIFWIFLVNWNIFFFGKNYGFVYDVN